VIISSRKGYHGYPNPKSWISPGGYEVTPAAGRRCRTHCRPGRPCTATVVTRISQDDDGRGEGVDNQEDWGTEYADQTWQDNLPIVIYRDNDQTAMKERPEDSDYNKLKAALVLGRVLRDQVCGGEAEAHACVLGQQVGPALRGLPQFRYGVLVLVRWPTGERAAARGSTGPLSRARCNISHLTGWITAGKQSLDR
jgi:hypothetical protein